MIACPAPETLEQVLAGALAEPDAAGIRAHLHACDRCRDLLDRLSDDAELRGWTPATKPAAGVAAEPRLAQLIRDLCATAPGPAVLDDAGRQAEVPLSFLGPPRQAGDLGTLGPYRVLGRLGQGGMGIVLRGHDDTLDRPVAIKVLRPDLADPAAGARFLREAQAAGRFQHDHIVRVHAVVSEPGQLPYLVMEYLAGETLADRLRARQRLASAEAAALVEQVARALAAAHAAGLVHRDVKPSNILIEAATGRAKVLDFGLARLAEGAGSLTQEGGLAGTPRYMSPEQVQRPGVVDARTDVYGLGVTLYEALTGEAPFRGTPARVLDQILHDEPRPPRQLNDAVPRDLQTVCLKAMAKEPGRRYPAAGELAADLQRWQRGEPIRARPAGVLERGWRWCRRNPRVAALTAALLLVFLGGFAGVVWQWRRAEANAEAARRHQALADENFRAALKAVDEYLVRVSENRLLNEPGLQPLRRELLETARTFYQRFVEQRRDDPAVREEWARSLFRLASITFLMDGPAPAADLLQEALPVQKELVQAHPDEPAYRIALGEMVSNLGIYYEYLNELDKSEAAYQEVLALSRQGTDPDSRLLALRGSINLGKLMNRRQQFARAETICHEALEIGSGLVKDGQKLPDSKRGLAVVYNNLGDYYSHQGQAGKAEESLKEAVTLWEQLLHDYPKDLAYQHELARSLRNLGDLYLYTKRLAPAEAVYKKALPVVERLARENAVVREFPDALAGMQSSLGWCYLLSGRPSEAQAACEEAIRTYEKLPDASPAYRAQLWLGLAAALSDLGRSDQALDTSGEALHALEDGPARGDPAWLRGKVLCLLHDSRAIMLGDLGRPAEAAGECDAALARDDGELRHVFTLRCAVAQARLSGAEPTVACREHHAAAVAELRRADAKYFFWGGVLYESAVVCAWCSPAAAQDDGLAAAERQAKSEEYAAYAVALLKRAQAQGYFRVPARIDRLAKDKGLEPLRGREDFQALLAALRQAKE
jgi:serine/threonine-protein kinase